MFDTIAAIATGNHVSAIGIIRLSGSASHNIANTVFFPASGKQLNEYPDRTLVYGELRAGDGSIIDRCMCTLSRAPNSYTGEDTAELHCHGSPTVLRLALERLFSEGARQASPGEFTKRAFLNGRMDLTQAEAVIDLIESETEEIAKNAAGQLGGAIQTKISAVYNSIVDIISHFHAVLDYPDEDIEPYEMISYSRIFEDAHTRLKALLDTFERGRIMKSGVRAAILGKPNVGKSTLLNALLGYDRAIVTSIPGTTRDTLEESVVVGGVKLRLIDTAGLRDADDPIEIIGINRAKSAAEGADLALVLIDLSQPHTDDDFVALRAAQAAGHVILVSTKADLPPGRGEAVPIPDGIRPPDGHVCLSAVTGEGLSGLESLVLELFPKEHYVNQGEIITNSRQFDAISRAFESVNAVLEAIEQGSAPDVVLTEAENALSALGELTGKTVRDDVIQRIFERFCVGK